MKKLLQRLLIVLTVFKQFVTIDIKEEKVINGVTVKSDLDDGASTNCKC